jgi:hypothetical protein
VIDNSQTHRSPGILHFWKSSPGNRPRVRRGSDPILECLRRVAQSRNRSNQRRVNGNEAGTRGASSAYSGGKSRAGAQAGCSP